MIIFDFINIITLNHGRAMTTGVNGTVTTPFPTQGFMEFVKMFNGILCWLLQNCQAQT